MKFGILLALAALIFASFSHAVPNPVPMSMVSILDTPAGKFIVKELRAVEPTSAGYLRTKVQLESRFARIRERFERTIEGQSPAFKAGSSETIREEHRTILSLIVEDELTQVRDFVYRASPYDISEATFLMARSGTRGAHDFYKLGSIMENGIYYTLLSRPTSSAMHVAPEARNSWETSLDELLSFLRVRPVTREVTLIPPVEHINARIESLNAELVRRGAEPIPVQFKEATTRAGVRSPELVPIRITRDIRNQDPVVTLGSILLTAQQIEILRADQAFLEAFVRYFKGSSRHISALPMVQDAFAGADEALMNRIPDASFHAASDDLALQMRSVAFNLARSEGRGGAASWANEAATPSERVARFLHDSPILDGATNIGQRIQDQIRRFAATEEGAALNAPNAGTEPRQALSALGKRMLHLREAVRSLNARSGS